MKWIKYTSTVFAAAILTTAVFAQEQKEKSSKNKEDKTEEIIIRKKSGKTDKVTIVVDGDNVTINGKPVDEFKNDDVTILKRDRPLVMASPGLRRLNHLQSLLNLEDEKFNDLMHADGSKAMLGVAMQKDSSGVKVTGVTKESGAEKAGLKKDDVITKVDNTAVASPDQLRVLISGYKPNDKVDITYKRDGKENKTTITLAENKSRAYSYNSDDQNLNFNFPKGPMAPLQNFNFNWNNKPKIGLQIQDIEDGKGVKVKDVDEDSPASKAGIKEGDIITQADGKDVAGVDDLRNSIKDLKEGDSVKFTYKREGKNQTAEIKLPKRLKSADL